MELLKTLIIILLLLVAGCGIPKDFCVKIADPLTIIHEEGKTIFPAGNYTFHWGADCLPPECENNQDCEGGFGCIENKCEDLRG